MACEKVTYDSINDDTMRALRVVMKAKDLPLPDGDEGDLRSESFNVTAHFKHDRETQTLEVTVTDKPFFIPCSIIDNKIKDAVTEARQKV